VLATDAPGVVFGRPRRSSPGVIEDADGDSAPFDFHHE
jgi:hypothetical protein